ncbi:MAG: hypothetical protein U0796_02750 [Gemmatales bacterium]
MNIVSERLAGKVIPDWLAKIWFIGMSQVGDRQARYQSEYC